MSGQTGRFRRADRLRNRRDYQRVSRRGRRVAGPYFVLLAAPGGSDRTRLGVTVSRKVGNAVERNYVKRRVREWFRRARGPSGRLGEAGAGRDLVVIARRGAAQLEGRRMAAVLGEAVHRLEEIRRPGSDQRERVR
jgi:ribonuclease P protein component